MGRVVVVEEHVFGVGELYRDGVVVGVAGLHVAGDEDEILFLTRAGVDEKPRRARAIAPVFTLLEYLVSGTCSGVSKLPIFRSPPSGPGPTASPPCAPETPAVPKASGAGRTSGFWRALTGSSASCAAKKTTATKARIRPAARYK